MAGWNLRRRDAAMLAVRRREGISLLQQGLNLTEVAQRLGVSPTAGGTWRRKFRADGLVALRPRRRSGRPPRIGSRLPGYLARLLSEDPPAGGDSEGGWTLDRLAAAARAQWGVACSRGTIWRSLRRQGFRWERAVAPMEASERPRMGSPSRARSGWKPGPRVLILIQSRNRRSRHRGGHADGTLNRIPRRFD